MANRLPALLQIFALAFFLAHHASAAVLGLDFGTLHLKAALVKPGIPLDIVLTKDSKRKEVAALAFKPNRDEKNNIIAEEGTFPERAYGGDALALQGRMPGEVFPNLKSLLGLHWDELGSKTAEIYNERYPALQLQHPKDLGTTAFKSGAFVEAESPFSVEELIGMELASIKRNAESMAGSPVEDAVVTVPVFYTAEEKQAIIKAAEFAGLNVNSLITDGLAVGLDYAKSRTFPDVTKEGKAEYHIVYDMGAGSTTATLMRFQGRSVKDVGRYNKTVQEVAVLGVGWDRTLGGDSLNDVVATDFIYKLLTKPALKSRGVTQSEVKNNGRLMARFYKEAERVRQVLSANTETTTSFEEILPDVDFRAKSTRAEFEMLTASFADRVKGPISDALDMAKLTIADIDSVILHGGAVRTPFVQKKLEEFVGDAKKLRSNVNADESAVFGAAFKAAGLSPSFKVKEIRDSDVAAYRFALTYTDKDKDRKTPLFLPNSPVGNGATTKQISFNLKEDFSFGLVQTVGEDERPIGSVKSENLTASVQKLVTDFGCELEQISTKFSVKLNSQTGLPEVISASVSCEVSPKAESVGDTVKDWLGFGKKKDQQVLGTGEDDGPIDEVAADASSSATSTPATSASSSGSASSAASAKASEPPKKRIESISLRWTTLGSESGLSKAETKRITERLRAFDQSDRARVAREEALNGLESFTYQVRDFLDNSDYVTFSTQDQISEIKKLLASTLEWMELPGELVKATKETLVTKLKALQDLVLPIKERRNEEANRPQLLKTVKDSLQDAKKLIDLIQSNIEKAQSSASATSTLSESIASSTVTSAPADDFGEAEDDESSSTTSTSKVPAFESPYLKLDISDIKARFEAIQSWLEDKEAEQNKLPAHANPVLLVKDLERKAEALATVTKDLVYEQMKVARAPADRYGKTKKSKTTKSKSATSTATSDATASSATAKGKESAKGSESLDDDVVTPIADEHDEL